MHKLRILLLSSLTHILPFGVEEDERPPVISSIAFDMASCDAIYLFTLPPTYTFNKVFNKPFVMD